MLNIHLEVPIETFSKLWLSGFKKLVTQSVFGELIEYATFKTSSFNSKIRGLGAKLCLAFLLF